MAHLDASIKLALNGEKQNWVKNNVHNSADFRPATLLKMTVVGNVISILIFYRLRHLSSARYQWASHSSIDHQKPGLNCRAKLMHFDLRSRKDFRTQNT